MKRNWHSSILYLISGILLVIALGLFGSPYLTNYETLSYHPRITRALINKTSHNYVSYNGQVAHPANLSDSFRAKQRQNVKIDGQMVAPHLHLPIDEGDGTDSLLLGAGTMTPNQKLGKGNYTLASHHMRNRNALFSPLYRYGRVGTKVWLTDDNRTYEYRIDQRKNVDETDVKILRPTKSPTLTLVTCQKTLGGRIRTILVGHLVKSFKYNRAPERIRYQFSRPCNNHRVLSGY